MLQAHIRLSDSCGAKAAIMPGDPARIDRILPFLKNARELAYNREFRSVFGEFNGLPVLAVSTGIGGASAGIAIEELCNIGITHMIRIGSCGALQRGVALGDLIIPCAAVRDDGASLAYVDRRFPAAPDFELMTACVQAAKAQDVPFHIGLARSHDSFYIDDEAEVSEYWSKRGVLGADMETAALFTIGRLRNVKTASILNNVVIYGEDTGDSIAGYASGEDMTALGERREILTALNAFCAALGEAQR